MFGKRLLAVAALFTGMLAFLPALASARTPTLKYPARGSSVLTLQHDLTVVGYTTSATGVFNHATLSQVKRFQKHQHLAADGVVGPATWKSIDKILKSETSQPDTPTSTTASATLPADDSGGIGMVPPDPTPGTTTTGTGTSTAASAPAAKATLSSNGTAVAPAGAPAVIQEVIAAANNIAFNPYTYGGGHNATFSGPGYDCSGSVSYALHGGSLLASPLDSTQFESYGQPGRGKWITIYSDQGHAWMTVAGLAFDTSNQSSSNGGDRWSAAPNSWEKSLVKDGTYKVTHPAGW